MTSLARNFLDPYIQACNQGPNNQVSMRVVMRVHCMASNRPSVAILLLRIHEAQGRVISINQVIQDLLPFLDCDHVCLRTAHPLGNVIEYKVMTY